MQPDTLKAPGRCRCASVLTSSVMPLKVDFLGFTHFGGFGGCHGWVGTGTALLCSVQRAKDAVATLVPLCFQDFPPRFVIDWSCKDENCFV